MKEGWGRSPMRRMQNKPRKFQAIWLCHEQRKCQWSFRPPTLRRKTLRLSRAREWTKSQYNGVTSDRNQSASSELDRRLRAIPLEWGSDGISWYSHVHIQNHPLSFYRSTAMRMNGSFTYSSDILTFQLIMFKLPPASGVLLFSVYIDR